MEKGLLSRRFLCEHHELSNLDAELINNIHRTKHQEIRVAYSFGSTENSRLYTIVESHDRLTVEAFFSALRIPCSSINEIDLQCQGRGKVEDLRVLRKAA